MRNATADLPLVRVTVRGGVAIDVTATIPLLVVIEDWDCPDLATDQPPDRHQFLSLETLSASEAAKYESVVGKHDGNARLGDCRMTEPKSLHHQPTKEN